MILNGYAILDAFLRLMRLSFGLLILALEGSAEGWRFAGFRMCAFDTGLMARAARTLPAARSLAEHRMLRIAAR